jgi:hypothetical protein
MSYFQYQPRQRYDEDHQLLLHQTTLPIPMHNTCPLKTGGNKGTKKNHLTSGINGIFRTA